MHRYKRPALAPGALSIPADAAGVCFGRVPSLIE